VTSWQQEVIPGLVIGAAVIGTASVLLVVFG
jgi:hypothetical protein